MTVGRKKGKKMTSEETITTEDIKNILQNECSGGCKLTELVVMLIELVFSKGSVKKSVLVGDLSGFADHILDLAKSSPEIGVTTYYWRMSDTVAREKYFIYIA